MSVSFTKLFSSITDSSIWCEDSDTKVVWVTMLAMSDQFGRIMAAAPGLAKRAGVELSKTLAALEKFKAPDLHSRTKANEGRRIEDIEGGWRLLNHDFYQALRSDEDRKEQNRLAQQRHRDRIEKIVDKGCQQGVSKCQQMSAESAHIDTDAYVYKNPPIPPKGDLEDLMKSIQKPLKSKKDQILECVIPPELQTAAFLEVWKEWTPWRMTKKKCKDFPNLFRLQLKQLSEWGPERAVAALNNTMMNDYQGIIEPKQQFQSKPKPSTSVRKTFQLPQENDTQISTQ